MSHSNTIEMQWLNLLNTIIFGGSFSISIPEYTLICSLKFWHRSLGILIELLHTDWIKKTPRKMVNHTFFSWPQHPLYLCPVGTGLYNKKKLKDTFPVLQNVLQHTQSEVSTKGGFGRVLQHPIWILKVFHKVERGFTTLTCKLWQGLHKEIQPPIVSFFQHIRCQEMRGHSLG